MKTTIKKLPLFISMALLGTASSVMAAPIGTAAGTDVDNTATISYSVGTTAQTVIESSTTGNSTPGIGAGSATTFKVDKKIDLSLTADGNVNVIPGSAGQNMTFTFKNEGNSEETFTFIATQAGGDQFDTTGCNTPPNVTLTSGDTATITVTCNIPAADGTAVTNGTTSKIDLKATIDAAVTETAGADTAGVDVVFADDTGVGSDAADRNGSHSATEIYKIATADLKVTKTSAVTSMDINGTAVGAATAKRIPGATVEYTIVVANTTGAAEAKGIVIADVIPAELEAVSGSVVVNGAAGQAATVTGNNVASPSFNLLGGESATLTIITKVK